MNEYDAINRYKSYAQKYLPVTQTLEGLWVPDFEKINNESKSDCISRLNTYIEQLKKYEVRLRQAANLRQEHYESFIKDKKEEEENHRKYRLGLNNIASDATDKLHYWTNIHDSMFSNYIEQFEKRRTPAPKYVYSINCDYEELSKIAKQSNQTKVVQKPKISKQEKKKRQKEKRKRKRKLEQEENIFMDEFNKEYNYYEMKEKEYISKRMSDENIISFNILYEEIRRKLDSQQKVFPLGKSLS